MRRDRDLAPYTCVENYGKSYFSVLASQKRTVRSSETVTTCSTYLAGTPRLDRCPMTFQVGELLIVVCVADMCYAARRQPVWIGTRS